MALNADQIINICVDIRGKLTLTTAVTGAIWDAGAAVWDAGTATWDSAAPGLPAKIVIQRAPPWAMNKTTIGGKKIQVRRHVIGTNPRTVKQLAQRAKMTAALAYWRDHNPQARAQAQPAASASGRNVYNVFLQMYLNNRIL